MITLVSSYNLGFGELVAGRGGAQAAVQRDLKLDLSWFREDIALSQGFRGIAPSIVIVLNFNFFNQILIGLALICAFVIILWITGQPNFMAIRNPLHSLLFIRDCL